jgi:hypothetical protein
MEEVYTQQYVEDEETEKNEGTEEKKEDKEKNEQEDITKEPDYQDTLKVLSGGRHDCCIKAYKSLAAQCGYLDMKEQLVDNLRLYREDDPDDKFFKKFLKTIQFTIPQLHAFLTLVNGEESV